MLLWGMVVCRHVAASSPTANNVPPLPGAPNASTPPNTSNISKPPPPKPANPAPCLFSAAPNAQQTQPAIPAMHLSTSKFQEPPASVIVVICLRVGIV